jgi:spore germination protein
MQIHVVAQGNTIWQIAQTYGVKWQDIIKINSLYPTKDLVIGQTILIPTDGLYTIQSGDSLWRISQKMGTSLEQLIAANPTLQDEILYPGMIIRLPKRWKPEITVNGFIEPRTVDVLKKVQTTADALTYITLFSYEVDEVATIKPLEEEALIKAAKAQGAAPMLSLTNIKNDQFDKEVGTAIFNSQELQNKLYNRLVAIMKDKGFVGVNFDFEYIGEENKEPYNLFLRNITPKLKEQGFIVSSALAPKQSATQKGDWYEAHDYKVHGEILDFVILMTYEWGWSGGPAMPVSPIRQVNRVIEYAKSVMNPKKIIMGINLYGYDWTLPYAKGAKFAKAISPVEAIDIASANNVSIQYDEKDEAPFYQYVDNQTNTHEVWFEDLRSMDAKFQLVKDYGLGGISYWNLGFSYPANWLLIKDRFIVK